MRTIASLLPLPLALTLLMACESTTTVKPDPSDTGTATDTTTDTATSTSSGTDTATTTDTGTDVITVNRTPTAPAVTLAPTLPHTGDDLMAQAAATDPDGDALTYAFAWTLDGVLQADLTAATVPGARVVGGAAWSVSVTAFDGQAVSDPGTASITIANTSPTLDAVTLSPADPGVEDAVVATVEGADDLDGDPVTITYTWFVDGFEVQTGPSDTLPPGFALKGQAVHVTATPDDGTDDGVAVESDVVLLRNTAPRGAGVSVNPVSPTTASGATCVPATATDPDPGDSVGWTYAWLRNGAEIPGETGDVLPGSAFARGDRLACRATPDDGSDAGAAQQSAQRTVTNAAPSLATVTLSSLAPVEGDTLSVTLAGLADTDAGDTAEAAYAWFVNGTQVSTSSTLPSSLFQKGDRIHVVVTPTDGVAEGAPVTSAEATVGNSAPTVTSVALSPTSVTTNSTLTATVTSSDPDSAAGDSVRHTYAWRVNGSPVAGVTGNTLSGVTAFNKGDTVTVRVTALDEDDAASAVVESAAVTVLDSPPTAPVVEITPAEPMEGDDLTCSVVTPSTDADGDGPITYTFAWEVDGVDAGVISATVPGTATTSGDVWACDVSASAGTQTSTVGHDELTVGRIGDSPSHAALSCKDILDQGASTGDGTYWVSPDGGAAYRVYCDMTTDGGGWTLMAKFSQHETISTMSATMYNQYFYNQLWIDGYAEAVPTSPVPSYDTHHVESVDWSDFMTIGLGYELRQRFFKGAGTAEFDVAYAFTYNGYTDQNSTSGSSRAWELSGRQVHSDTTGIIWDTPSEPVRFWLPWRSGVAGSKYSGCYGFEYSTTLSCGEASSDRRTGNAGLVGATSDNNDPAGAWAPHTNPTIFSYDLVHVSQATNVFGLTGAAMTLLYYIR